MNVSERAREVVADVLARDHELPAVKYRAQAVVAQLAAEGLLSTRRLRRGRPARKSRTSK